MIIEEKEVIGVEPTTIDVSKMVNDIFKADSEWLKRMCVEEVAQREANEARSTQT
jgi:hypothetical protein